MDACLGADVNLVSAIDGLSGFRAKHFQIRLSLTESVRHGGNFTAHIPGLVISALASVINTFALLSCKNVTYVTHITLYSLLYIIHLRVF